MPTLSTKNRYIFCLAFLASLSIPNQAAWAGDADFLSKISPHFSLTKNVPAQELQSFTLSRNPQGNTYEVQGGNYTPALKKSMSDQDLFSLALGARFQISDWLGLDAACAMPLAEEETVWKKDLAIEAMVTMQF